MGDQIVRHILACRFSPSTTDEQFRALMAAFRDLAGKIDGIVSIEFGANNSPEGKAHGMTHLIQVTFTNAQARDAYLPHPAHVQFAERFGQMGILEDLLVIDYAPLEN